MSNLILKGWMTFMKKQQVLKHALWIASSVITVVVVAATVYQTQRY